MSHLNTYYQIFLQSDTVHTYFTESKCISFKSNFCMDQIFQQSNAIPKQCQILNPINGIYFYWPPTHDQVEILWESVFMEAIKIYRR